MCYSLEVLMTSLTQWTWVWVDSLSWWWTERGLACCSPWGRKVLDMTEWLNWTELCCFHVLAIVSSATMNIGVHVTFQIRIFVFSSYPRNGIAGSYDDSIFMFLRKIHTVSRVVAPVYILTNCSWIFLFSTLSSELIICRPFDDGLSDKCEVIPHCSFHLYFL